MASAASNYNKTLIQIQKLANSSAKSIQAMIGKSNKEQAVFNSAEASKARSWQEKMSKTAHQMEVADLKKAGLNPVLSTGGSGAQSYTTSSASTQNDSGASATAAILSDELGAMSNMESARMNADASLKASERQAKAARYAAQQSAAAQMYAAKYAADRSYALGVYKTDKWLENESLNRSNQRWKVKNETANSWPGIVDKFLRNSGLGSTILNGVERKSLKNLLSYKGNNLFTADDFTRKVSFKNPYNVSKSNFQLTKEGYRAAKYALNNNGFVGTNDAARLYVRCIAFHDKTALKPLMKYHVTQYKSSQGWSTKPGWR